MAADVYHNHQDQNSVVVYRREWLLADPGYLVRESDRHDTLLIDGLGQDKTHGGKLGRSFASPAVHFLEGEAGVQLVVDKGLAGERSARTVVHVYRSLSAALRQAVRWQLLPANPAAAVQPPRPPRPTLAIIDPEMASRILEASKGTALEIPVTLALATGARRGEILGLAWSDVDLDRGTIRIRRTLQAAKSGLRFEEPKTDRSRRTVTLPAFAVETLRQHRKTQAERRLLLGPAWHAGDLVIEQGDGQPVHPDLMTQWFGRFLARAALPPARFHDLRHAHATMMLSAGIHPKVVSERLGHGGIGITLDTYSHVIPVLEGEAARVIDQVLSMR